MSAKGKDQGGYTLPMALIMLSLLFTIAGIAVAGLAQQAKETRYFKGYQIFLLDCKTAMAECEATAMADPEGLNFPQRGKLQNADYACYVEKREDSGYTLLLEIKGGAYAQTYEGKVLLVTPIDEEKTAYRTKRVVLSSPPVASPLPTQSDETPEPESLPVKDTEETDSSLPSDEMNPPDASATPEPPIKKVSEVLWSIK